MPEIQTVLRDILTKYESKQESLIPVLQDIQVQFNFLPEDCLKEVAERLGMPLNQVFAVATFYNAFSLKPKGKYIIQVCLGTACHVRRAPRIVEELERALDVKRGETTLDQKFTLETVNCLGACALGPVMTINNVYYGHLTPENIRDILQEYT
jgi:NADH-quinone oxidoreductase E subunit